jgi:predicted RNA-binding protein with PIN domain
MPHEPLVTTTPITKEAGLAEETGLSDLRRIVEGLPNAENLLGLLVRKGASKPDDFTRLFSKDDEVRDQVCGSIRQAIQGWVLQKFPQLKEPEDLINDIFTKVLEAVDDRYDPTRAPLLAYVQPYFHKGYDEVARHLAIHSIEQPESAMTESVALDEDETEEVAESVLERMPSKLPSPEDKAIAKETSDKLAERVGFQSGAELLATLEDTEALPKVKRHRLRKQLQKAMETLTEVKVPMPSDEARPICLCRDELIPLVSFRAFGVAYFLWRCPNCGRRLIAPTVKKAVEDQKDHLKVVDSDDSDGYVKSNIRRPVEEAVVRKEISQERRARRLLQRIRGRTSWR